MKNQELAKIFFEIADYLDIDGVSFKPYAYRRVALFLDTSKDDVGEIYRNGGIKALREIPGVGEGIAMAIEEYLKKGKIKHFEELKKKLPLKVDELLKVDGLGPKKIKVLYQKLGVKNLKDLEKAVKSSQNSSVVWVWRKNRKEYFTRIRVCKTK